MVEATGPCLPPGYLIFYHLPTKVGNLPDRTGEMAPTLVWCHPCSNEDQSPHLFDFPWSYSQEHKSAEYKQKT